MSLSTLKNRDLETVHHRQLARLMTVSKVVFTDPVIMELRKELKKVREERDQLRASLTTCINDMVSPSALLEALVLYNKSDVGMFCCCRHCVKAIQLSPNKTETRVQCAVFGKLIEFLHAREISFAFKRYHMGGLCEDHPPVPSDFPPARSTFPSSMLSHLDKHIVFRRMGNAYDFSFGKPLWNVDSPHHAEGAKILGLIKTLHQQSILG